MWISPGDLNDGNNGSATCGIKGFVPTHLGNFTTYLITSIFNITNLEFIAFNSKDTTARNRKEKENKMPLGNFLWYTFHWAEKESYSSGDLNVEKILAQFSHENGCWNYFFFFFFFCFAIFFPYRIFKESYRIALFQFFHNSTAENNWLQ